MIGNYANHLLLTATTDYNELAAIGAIGAFVVALLALAYTYLGKLLKDRGEIVEIKTNQDNLKEKVIEIEGDIQEIWSDLVDKGKKIEHITVNCDNTHKNSK